jgi:hypothetical protein
MSHGGGQRGVELVLKEQDCGFTIFLYRRRASGVQEFR